MDYNVDLREEMLPVDDLVPYENNARKHGEEDVEAIVNSIKRFGFVDPIGIWKENIIVEGHGRLEAAKKLGMKEVPVIHLDHLTDEERRAYALAHNKTAELSGWDFEKLDLELEDLDFDMSEFGFEIGEVEWDEGTESIDDYEKPVHDVLECPSCHHQDRAANFRKVN